MAKAFYVDVSHCVGCYNCQLACKDEHAGNDWLPYAKAQPDTGQFWLKIEEHVRGTIPKVKMHYVPRLCGHCENAACVAACKHEAIARRDDGLLLIDPEKCKGCRKCVDACAYGAVYFNEEEKIAQKCTGCAHLIDVGEEPRCVQACVTECLRFGEESEMKDLLKGAEELLPDSGYGARAYYSGIPGRFVAGTIYDPKEKEVVIGAKVELTDKDGKTKKAQTDAFGDFWFKDLPEGKSYTVTIRAKGFADKVIKNVSTKTDANLGDVPLKK
ncbi:MAG: carboxypeptidase regulatory-like domain-containing protein [Clostridiales Family XIII bacterium]|jgi:Fe-S-cluster-containing dehydrogenase component|nr:carboxypeptidase regulatory-like domain-containing protein [Clostridiales Family XIII bacterium]